MSFLSRIEQHCRQTPDKMILSDGLGEYSYSQTWSLSGQVYAWLLENGIGGNGNRVGNEENGIGGNGNKVGNGENGIGGKGNRVGDEENGIGGNGNRVGYEENGIGGNGNKVGNEENGIGSKEDVVMVRLPRSAEAVVAMLGVFRAGAAVIVVEDWGRNEWIEAVEQEVRPRLIIDSESMAAIRRMPATEGYVEHKLHDLAYITYTTGTTGKSKGVMHEYGTLERIIKSCEAQEDLYDYPSQRTAVITTLHSAVTTFVLGLATGAYTDIVPPEVYADPVQFNGRLSEKHITYTYLSPVYLHKYGMLTAPDLQYVTVSFEPANAIFSDKVDVYNEYGMSETGSTVCWFQIDRPYDITPIGKPMPGYQLSLLDEQGQPVADGELGEICINNTYCRGYLNRPEETAEHFRDGLYHTHDLGKRLPDGNYVMYGRTSDAVRTKDGLLIALEIEVAARRVMGQSSAYVKVFPASPDQSQGQSPDQNPGQTTGQTPAPVICLYTDFPIDFQAVQAALSKELAAYKLPTDHVQVDHFEYNNGKAIRVHLANPRL